MTHEELRLELLQDPSFCALTEGAREIALQLMLDLKNRTLPKLSQAEVEFGQAVADRINGKSCV